MTVIKHVDIGVIGDEELVNAMRLAGISRYHVIKEDQDPAGNVRKALNELLADPDIGIAIILEDYAPHVLNLLSQVKKTKGVTPVIVEVPSRFGTRHADVREHYRALIRESIGFEVEI